MAGTKRKYTKGPDYYSDENIKKRSDAVKAGHKKRKEYPEYEENKKRKCTHSSDYYSEENVQKRSNAAKAVNKKRKEDPSYNCEENKKKRSDAVKAGHKKRKKHPNYNSEENKKKRSESTKARWNNYEFRNKMISIMNSIEYKNKQRVSHGYKPHPLPITGHPPCRFVKLSKEKRDEKIGGPAKMAECFMKGFDDVYIGILLLIFLCICIL